MTVLLFLVPPIAAAAIAYALTPLAARFAEYIGAIDQPGPRKIHTTPIPRLGGAAVIIALAAVLSMIALSPGVAKSLSRNLLAAIAIGVVPVLAVSVVDDIRSQGARIKFAAHFLGASIAVALGVRLNDVIHLMGYEITIGWLAVPISIVWLAGITNAFNIVDGLDGLSAGLALISAVSLAGVSLVTHNYAIASTAAVLAGALVGFLPFNFFPAKVYLGDTGATAIGFFLGCVTLSGGSTTSSGLAVTLPLLVVGVPVADTLLAMVRRMVRRVDGSRGGLFEADSNHIHHRLLALGFDHRRAVITLYGVGLLLAGVAFASLFIKWQDAGVLLVTLLFAAVVGISKLGYDEFAVVRNGAVLKFYDAPVLKKGLFVVFADLATVTLALYIAVVLKYDDWGLTSQRALFLSLLALLPAVTIATFGAMQIYRRSWSHANIDDGFRIAVAVGVSTAAAYVIARFTASQTVSLTFFITYGLAFFILVGGNRVSYRLLYHWNRTSNLEGDPVIIYGAGKGGTIALREILTNSDVPMRPIGFIDDDPSKSGRFINGYPVFGGLDALEGVVANLKATGLVVASDKIPIGNVRKARNVCERNGVWLRAFKVDFTVISSEPLGLDSK